MKDLFLVHKDYIASVKYSHADGVYYGRIELIDDLVLFEGASVDELQKEFQKVVENLASADARIGRKARKGGGMRAFRIYLPIDSRYRLATHMKNNKLTFAKLVRNALQKLYDEHIELLERDARESANPRFLNRGRGKGTEPQGRSQLRFSRRIGRSRMKRAKIVALKPYKGYVGSARFVRPNRLIGQIDYVSHKAAFRGSDFESTQRAFCRAVDSYLSSAESEGREIDKPPKEFFEVRLPPEKLVLAHRLAGKFDCSVREIITRAVNNTLNSC